MQVWRHIHLRSRTMGHLVGKDRNALNVSNSPIILYVSLMLYIFVFYNFYLTITRTMCTFSSYHSMVCVHNRDVTFSNKENMHCCFRFCSTITYFCRVFVSLAVQKHVVTSNKALCLYIKIWYIQNIMIICLITVYLHLSMMESVYCETYCI